MCVAGVAWRVWQVWLAADCSTGSGTRYSWCSIQHTSTQPVPGLHACHVLWPSWLLGQACGGQCTLEIYTARWQAHCGKFFLNAFFLHIRPYTSLNKCEIGLEVTLSETKYRVVCSYFLKKFFICILSQVHSTYFSVIIHTWPRI